MSSNWKGYLLKAIRTEGTTEVETIFPNEYIQWNSWQATPDQREELIAYRDDNSRDLHRVTADGMKSTFSFNTRTNIQLAQKDAILKFFKDNEVDSKQRKIKLEFWNDDTSSYDVGYFYRPNMPFKIIKLSNDNIWYDSLTLEFIEY